MLKFTVRKSSGEIVKQQEEYRHDLTNEIITWIGSHRDEVIRSLQQLPKYTRGKVKADLMWRDIPQKELKYCDDFGIELVMSEAMYKEIKERHCYDDFHYEDGSTSECRMIDGQRLPFLIMRTESKVFSTVALFNMCESVLCSDMRNIHSLGELYEAVKLYEAVELYEWLTHFRNNCSAVKIKIERYGYEDERQMLYIQPEGKEKRRICELSHAQKKIINLGTAKSTLVKMCSSITQTIENNDRIRFDLTGDKEE